MWTQHEEQAHDGIISTSEGRALIRFVKREWWGSILLPKFILAFRMRFRGKSVGCTGTHNFSFALSELDRYNFELVVWSLLVATMLELLNHHFLSEHKLMLTIKSVGLDDSSYQGFNSEYRSGFVTTIQS